MKSEHLFYFRGFQIEYKVRRDSLNIIVHQPLSVDAKEELSKRVADCHIRAVLDKITKLPVDSREKLSYLQKIERSFL